MIHFMDYGQGIISKNDTKTIIGRRKADFQNMFEESRKNDESSKMWELRLHKPLCVITKNLNKSDFIFYALKEIPELTFSQYLSIIEYEWL